MHRSTVETTSGLVTSLDGPAARSAERRHASLQVLVLTAAIRLCLAVCLAVPAANRAGLLDLFGTVPAPAVQPVLGHQFAVRLDDVFAKRWWRDLVYVPDTNDNPSASSLVLSENGRRLGLPHAVHQDIATAGEGRYSHWGDALYFASSDNTDPRGNGRSYDIALKPSTLRLLLVPALACVGLLLCRRRLEGAAPMPEVVAAEGVARRIAGLFGMPMVADAVVFCAMASMAIYLLATKGLHSWQQGDDSFYVLAADQLASGAAWTSVPDLHSKSWQLTLLRMPGYPLFIMAAKAVAGAYWQQAIVGLQIVVALTAGHVVYRTVASISGLRVLGALSAMIFLLSERGTFDRYLLVDSFFTSVAAMMLCRVVWLIDARRAPNTGDLLLVGASLAALVSVREAAVVLAAAAAPLFVLLVRDTLPRMARRLAGIYLPLVAVLAMVLAWNSYRTGYLVLTTGAQEAPLYGLGQVEKEGTPVFTGESLLDRTARKHHRQFIPSETREIYGELWREHGLLSPDIARMVTRKYLETWLAHPRAMLGLIRRNIEMWPNVMVPLAFGDASTAGSWMLVWPHLRNLFLLGLVALPLAWLGAAAVTHGARHRAMLVCALVVLISAPAIQYSAIHFEIRYMLFSAVPLLLIFALSASALMAGVKRLGRRWSAQGA